MSRTDVLDQFREDRRRRREMDEEQAIHQYMVAREISPAYPWQHMLSKEWEILEEILHRADKKKRFEELRGSDG